MKTVFILVLVGVIATLAYGSVFRRPAHKETSPRIEPHIAQAFEHFKTKFNKKYESAAEEAYRLRVFRDFVIRIKQLTDAGTDGVTLGITKFADLTKEEFRSRYLARDVKKSHNNTIRRLPVEGIPAKVDWVAAGAVTPIKNQGQCGSCWAFCAIGTLESANFIKSGSLISLSEQQLVDCSGSFGNEGCDGGDKDAAYQYAIQYGIESEADYPYAAEDKKCRYDASKVVVQPKAFVDVPQNQQDQLAAAIAQQPVGVYVEADTDYFQGYVGGVITSKGCGTDLDHAIIAVGYDTTADTPFFNAKNSWGSDWGENGYVRIAYQIGQTGAGICGIASTPSYPTL